MTLGGYRVGNTYNPKLSRSPMVFKPSKDTKAANLLTYIRQQKTARSKRIKITLAKKWEP